MIVYTTGPLGCLQRALVMHVCVCLCLNGVCVHVMCVVPYIGKPVMVVNGAYRGLRAILEGLNTAQFCVSVRIDQVCIYTHT